MDSVLSQDIPGMEYVVMDGGSTDGSTELIRQYAPRLSGWVSEKDRGQADAVNKGAARTHGEVIGWLNSDDLFLPGAARKALGFLADHPDVDAVYGDVLSIDGEGRLINVMRFAPYSAEDLMSFRVISQPGVFFRRSAWERAGGLDLSYSYLLDHHLWLRMIADGKFAYLTCRGLRQRGLPAGGLDAERSADSGESGPDRKKDPRRCGLAGCALSFRCRGGRKEPEGLCPGFPSVPAAGPGR